VGKLIDQRRNELQDKIKMTPRSQRPVQSRPYRHTSDGLGTAGGKAVPSAREGSMSDATHQKILCIRVTGQDEAIRALLAKNPTEPHAVRRAEKEVSVELFLPEQVLEQIDRKRLHVQVLYDATARGQERQQDVGKGNRFEGEHRLFEGFGKKTKEEPR
jgi:hypothetical protein